MLLVFISRFMLNNFFMILVVKENARLKLALAIPTRILLTHTKEIKDTTPLVADKSCQNNQKQ